MEAAMISPDTLLLIVGAVIAGFVQGLSGFAFSMVAVSIWVWGLDPKLVSVMAVFGSLTGQIVAMASVRRGLHLAVLGPYLAGGLVGIPIGVFLLPLLDPNVFKLILGIVLVGWCPTMLLSGNLPQVCWGGRVADAVSGLAGGFMGGLGGITGAIPTLWTTLRGLEKNEQRAIIQNFNLATLAVTFVAYLMTGVVSTEMWPMFPVVALALFLPARLGVRVYARMSQARFRQIVLLLLSFSGLAVLCAALPKLLA